MIKLVVALGNPGPEYELTRHNIGWLLLDSYPQLDGAFWKEKFKGIFSDKTINGNKVYFLKPQTFMNLSGESIQPLAHFFKIRPDEILVIHDELDLPLGSIHFKKGGGLAGHNGLKSTAKCMGTQDFLRMRIGIGRPKHGSVSSWVLSSFPKEQDIELGIVLENSAKALDYALKNGLQKAANQYNKKDFLAIK
jgi:PTH1 family peptidyl-tRNA hydrolase